jgi:hypothetical protein
MSVQRHGETRLSLGLSHQASGEEVMGATTAAIANAFFDATGARLHQYPMTRRASSLRLLPAARAMTPRANYGATSDARQASAIL